MTKRILIGGGSGLIGQSLTTLLEEYDCEVYWLSRTPDQYEQKTFHWDPTEGTIDPNALDDIDVVIQLAGAGIADKPWTDRRKEILRSSRIDSHQTMIQAIRDRKDKPTLYLAPSAIGYYGDRGDDWLTETAEPGEGFLPELSQEWESAADAAAETGIRLVKFRIGLVLSPDGGMLNELLPYYKWGIGTVFGSGKQFYSWIHIRDLCRMFLFAIREEELSGVYNAVAPNPVQNEHFARALRSAIQRPGILLPAPGFALRLLLGNLSKALLDSARVSPEKIKRKGFSFEYPELQKALMDLLD